MDVAINVLVGFGSAVLGAVVGFLGSRQIERARQRERRRGIIAILEGDLSSNVVKMRGFQRRIALPIEQRPFDLVGPPSCEFWIATRIEVAAFLPLDLVYRLGTAYQELEPFRASMNAHPLLINVGPATALVEQWIQLAESLQDELMTLEELKDGYKAREKTARFLIELTERKRAAVATSTTSFDWTEESANGQRTETQ